MAALGLLHAALWCVRVRGVGATYGPRIGRPASRMLAGATSASALASADLRSRFVGALRHEAQVGQGATVVALVSGGLDSVALLHLLAHARPEFALDLHVLHFNHHTRAECDGEEAFVRELAEQYRAPFHVRHLAELPSSGLQAQTRSWRRGEATALLGELAAARPCAADGVATSVGSNGEPSDAAAGGACDAVIVLGHHADDDVETILLKWLRGCHVTRLAGMRPRAGPFARPLLRFGKAELEGWMRGQSFEWREDASNARPDYRRNQVRLELVPLLQQLTGGALGSRLADLTAQAAEARGLLDWARGEPAGAPGAPVAVARAAGALDVPALLAMPAAVQTDVLHGFIAERTGRPSAYAEVQRVLARLRAAESGGRTDAADVFKPGRATTVPAAAPPRQPASHFDLHLAGRWVLRRRGARLSVCALDADADDAAERWVTTTLVRSSNSDSDDATCQSKAAHQAHARDVIRVTHLAEHEVELTVADKEDEAHADEDGGDDSCDAITLYNLPPGSLLRVRARVDGDRLTPAWRERPIKLKDFLRGQKVPLHARDELSVVVREPPEPAQAAQVLAVYPLHVGRECARNDRHFPPVRLRIRARRMRDSGAPVLDEDGEDAEV